MLSEHKLRLGEADHVITQLINRQLVQATQMQPFLHKHTGE